MSDYAKARIPGRRHLHSPGPTHLPDEVLDAMHRQPLDLADPRMDRMIADCEAGLQRLLDAPQADILMFAANGHGAWEAAIVNLLPPGGCALVPGTGHFSESWAQQCEGLGYSVRRTAWREGLPIDPLEVAAVLRADTAHEIAAVFLVHTDTASGVSCDLPSVCREIAATGHPALVVVDVVASLGAAEFSFARLGVDVAVGASQKGLMVPPGLSFVAVSARARERARANPAPRFYWDFERRIAALGYRKFCGTPPQPLLMGLQASIALLEREGLRTVQARHARLARATAAAVDRWALGGTVGFFCRQPAARSVSVTTVAVAAPFDPEAIRTVARESFQVSIAGGLGPLAGRVFRIGHLGDLNEATLLGSLAGVEAAMRVLGIPLGSGALDAAIGCLAAPDTLPDSHDFDGDDRCAVSM